MKNKSKYKFIGEDQALFHIAHPDGTRFSIAKNAVGPAVHQQIKKLDTIDDLYKEPIKMAGGGEADIGAAGPLDANQVGHESDYAAGNRIAKDMIAGGYDPSDKDDVVKYFREQNGGVPEDARINTGSHDDPAMGLTGRNEFGNRGDFDVTTAAGLTPQERLATTQHEMQHVRDDFSPGERLPDNLADHFKEGTQQTIERYLQDRTPQSTGKPISDLQYSGLPPVGSGPISVDANPQPPSVDPTSNIGKTPPSNALDALTYKTPLLPQGLTKPFDFGGMPPNSNGQDIPSSGVAKYQPNMSASTITQPAYDPAGNQMQVMGQNIKAQQDINSDLGKSLQQGFQSMNKNQADLVKGLDDINKYFTPLQNDLQNRSNVLFQGVMDQKIDPNRVWSSMGVGNKIGAAIMVGLSGIGSGLTGKSNMAMDVIQKTIDRDIEAQKLDLGKKETLFSENLRQLGDVRAAKAATASQLISVAQAQAQMISTKMAGAQSNTALQLANKELDLKKSMLNAQSAALSLAAKGGNFDPSILVPRLVPPEHQKAVFEEIDRAQNTKRMSSAIMDAFEQAVKDTSGPNAVISQARTPRSVLALHQALQPTFKDLEGTVRQAAMDNTFMNVSPSGFDLGADTETRRNALKDYLRSKSSAPTAKGFNIDLDKFQSTTKPTLGPVERQTKDGRIALFDPETKDFLGYK